MLNIIGKRKINLTISAILVVASWAAVAVFGLKLSRDFTGGTLWELQIPQIEGRSVWSKEDIEGFMKKEAVEGIQITESKDQTILIRSNPLSEEQHQKILNSLRGDGKDETGILSTLQEVRFESIGPTVGNEMKNKAVKAIVIALVAIVAYITWAFRKVSRPVSSWKYGVSAVIALMHDVSIPTGLFAVLGKFAGYEVDALFVTALLTVLGFSVHDTIVVFDRIRENLLKRGGKDFEETANTSVNETLTRSINTSLATLLVLLALYVLGGSTTTHFVLVLLVGIFFGTYSSIFVASPLLVIWNRFSTPGKR